MTSLGRTFYSDGTNWHSVYGDLLILASDPPPPDPPFEIGFTRPTKLNTGPNPFHTLVPYTGPSAGGVLTITAPVTYDDVDFGATNTRVKINSSDVRFNNCRFVNKSPAIYTADPGPLADCRGGTSYTNRIFYRCSFDNQHQWSPVMQAIMGYGFTMERCWAENFQDALGLYCGNASVRDINVSILGCLLGPVSFWYSPTGGQVHSSDTKSHNDVIQWHGGRNWRVEGCDLQAIYSTTIGTGTPNSGNNTSGLGASGAPYTQAAGVTARYNIVEGGGLYSPGKPGALLGGSLSALMFTPVGGRNPCPVVVIKRCWGTGGAFWGNAGGAVADAADVTWTFEVTENRIDNNQRIPGRAVVINSAVTKVRMPTTGIEASLWTDGSGVITRRTG